MKKTAGEPAFSVKSRFPVPPANSDRLAENPIDGYAVGLPADTRDAYSNGPSRTPVATRNGRFAQMLNATLAI